LLSWVIQRVIEMGYLLIVLQTVDSQQAHATSLGNAGFDTVSFVSSAMSEMHASPGSMQTVSSAGGYIVTMVHGVLLHRPLTRTSTALNDEPIEEESAGGHADRDGD
jgi:hypothetical protein